MIVLNYSQGLVLGLVSGLVRLGYTIIFVIIGGKLGYTLNILVCI